MSTTIVRFRTAVAVAAGLLGSISMFPNTASAQAGAIGAGVSRTLTGENLYENAPIFTNSALVLPRGVWAAGADFVFLGFPSPPGGRGQILTTAFYGATTKLTLGVLASPLVFTTGLGSQNTSGVGDVSLDGRYQFWRSDEGRTKVLGLVRLGLPTANENLGSSEGVTVVPGVTATHQARNLTLNAGVSVNVPTDAADASFFEADAAVILGVHRNLGLSLEAFGLAAEDNSDYFAIAPGARLRIGKQVFAEAAIAVIASRSSTSTADYILLLGLAYAR